MSPTLSETPKTGFVTSQPIEFPVVDHNAKFLCKMDKSEVFSLI